MKRDYGPSDYSLAYLLIRTIEKLEEITDPRESELRNLIANAKFWINEIQKQLLQESERKE